MSSSPTLSVQPNWKRRSSRRHDERASVFSPAMTTRLQELVTPHCGDVTRAAVISAIPALNRLVDGSAAQLRSESAVDATYLNGPKNRPLRDPAPSAAASSRPPRRSPPLVLAVLTLLPHLDTPVMRERLLAIKCRKTRL